MSVETDMFYISVIGPKANVTRMLNEAIRQEGAGELIVAGDDIETINRKITGRDGKPGMMVKFAELIDEKCLEDDALLKERWQAAVDSHNQKMAAEDSSDGDFEMDIELAKVVEYDSDSFEVKFSEYVPEWVADFDCIDWAGWEDIARVYKCRVFVDDDYYRNGEFMRFECATIYEPTEDGVKQTRLESGETRKEYDEFMDKLAELYPERYIPIRERYLKVREEEMAYQREMKRLEEKYQLIEPIHNKTWDSFTSAEEKGIGAVKEVYASCLEQVTKRIAWVDMDSLLQVMMVRAEELKGINDNLSHCYVDLLRGFRHDYDKKVKELKKQYPKSTIFIDIEPEAWDEQYGWLECYPYEKYEPEAEEETSQYPIDENGHAVIPEGTTIIDDYAFLQCKKLVSVSIPDTVEEISEGAFGSCENLTSITLPSSLGFIDEAAFFGCKGLKSLVIPNGVKMIDARAFAECTSLSEVHLPAGVAIDSSAFNGSPSYMYFEFGTVKQMINAVDEAISNGSLLHFSSEPDNTTQIYHTKKFKEKIVLRYRKNKIFYTISAHNTIYDSWTIHQEKVLKNFIKLYESTK